MPSKYNITYTIANGKAIISAQTFNGVKIPTIVIKNYTTASNLDYVLRLLGEQVINMPNTLASFANLYDRNMQGEIKFTNAQDVVGDIKRSLTSGQTGANAVVDLPGNLPDFAMTISVPQIKNLANFYEGARNGKLTGTGLSSQDITQIRGRDSTLDALIYLFGHEIGGHIGKAGFESQNHDDPVTIQTFEDPIYRAGYADAYAAGVGTYKRDASGGYYYLGNLSDDPEFDYFSQAARIQYGGGKGKPGTTANFKLEPIFNQDETLDLSSDPSVASGAIGQILGSSLARYIGGGLLEQLVTSPLLGAVGQNIAQFISAGGVGANAATARGAFDKSFGDFSQDLKIQLQGAAVGTISSFLALELGNSLGINGFGGELVTTGAGSVFGQVLNNAAAIASTPVGQTAPSLFAGLDGNSLFGKDLVGQGSNIGLVNSAFASFFGSKLGALILSPTNTEGAVLSSIGASLGAWAFGAGAASAGAIGSVGAALAGAFQGLGSFVAPLVGSLIGFLLGSLIGRLFGSKKPRVPSASAEAMLSIGARDWTLGQVTSVNGGNREAVTEAARLTADTINGVLALATGTRGKVVSTTPLIEKVGHTGQTIYLDRIANGYTTRLYSGSNLSEAVETGSIDGIKTTRVYGGDLFVKRAIAQSQASNLVELMGDIQTASDYGMYLNNRTDINTLITQSPTSEFAVTWAITLQRASELGLNAFQASDFQGGLGGFLSSLGFGRTTGSGEVGLGYENLHLTDEGGALRIATTDGSAPFNLFSWTNNVSNPDQSVLIQNFAASTGYTAWAGQATAGNDIWIASGGGPVTMDDTGTQYYGYWDPYYGYYQYPVTVSGGDDIFVGSDYDDVLYGQTGGDWLDGGAGFDVIDGGAEDDVVIGGAGNDRLLGGTGDDYISGGDGDDYFYDEARTWGLYGGEGNDILVGGGGSDALYGEAGDDIFLIDQDGGGTWDAINGQDGLDTISYECFNAGVYVDFNVLGGWSWDPTAKSIYGDSITNVENVTGTSFADIIVGDAGNNIVRGLEGADQLYGSDGDDVLDGGLGADYLDGGAGIDTASYERAFQGVVISLADMVATNGDAQDDTFVSIENLRGSQFADDLTGDSGSNVLAGLAGDDFFSMTAGSDLIDGGEGFDTLDASTADGPLTVYYDAGYYDPYYGYYPGAGWVASTANYGTTTLNSIEGFIGGDYDDYLSGSDADETFRGGLSNDTLAGGNGSDTYIYQPGDGHDSISDTSDGANTIAFDDPDFGWGDITIRGADYQNQYGALGIGMRGSSEIITVGSNFNYINSGAQEGNHNHVIKTISLGGSEIDISKIDWTPDETYSQFATTIYGAQNHSDLIFAMAGDDTIYTAGDAYGYEIRGNVVYGGSGNDTIFGSAGDDQYIFERNNGVDSITEQGGDDTIIMGPKVAEDDVIYEVVTTSGSSGDYGSSADLYIGIRDLGNPALTASQVADRVQIIGGGTKYVGAVYGTESFNTIEHVRVAGQEVDLSKANINWITSYYYDGGSYYPIALDLDGDGIELRSVNGSRIASVESDGTITRMGWLGQDDGFLALDRDGNGVIDRIGEISFVGDLAGAKTDLEGLAAYDSNADGKLDASDKGWSEFKIWQDKNQDGFGSKDELVNLDVAGVSSINLKGQLTGFSTADGPDNTVIATTDVVWKDTTRTGSAYDVALARLQVRTDDATKGLADLDAPALGERSGDIEDKLRGIQALTSEQAAAIKDRKSKQVNDGSEGQLYRIETLLGNESAKIEDGLFSIDPKFAKLTADIGQKLSLLDQFADSEWTKARSLTPGKADVRGADAPFKKAELTNAQKAMIEDARKTVADRKVVDDTKGFQGIAKDAADAVLQSAPTPPSAQEMERLKQKDKFQLLEGAADSDNEIDGTQPQRMAAKESSGSLDRMTASEENVAAASEGPETVRQQTPEPVETARRPSGAETTPQGSTLGEQSDETDVYGVVIRAANARLVQALASFGDAPAMMANYQGQNAANDAQAAWLSVDAMPSVQRLASIR